MIYGVSQGVKPSFDSIPMVVEKGSSFQLKVSLTLRIWEGVGTLYIFFLFGSFSYFFT